MSSQRQELALSIGIIFGALVLVIWIRGGFDPALAPSDDRAVQRSGEPRQESYPIYGRPLAEIEFDEIADLTPDKVLQLMMMGRTGPYSLQGITEPRVQPASSATTADDAEILGVEVDGHHRAYSLSMMGTPHTHVINDVIDHLPVTVTYCNKTGCARVLTDRSESDRALDVGVGGFADGQMLLHIADQNYGQNSPQIPLEDLEFVRTTWAAWKTAYPDTEVCDDVAPGGDRDAPPSGPDSPDRNGSAETTGE